MNILMKVFRNNIAEIGTPTCTAHTSNSLTITGSVKWYKDGATYGIAYKAEGVDNWSHVSSSTQDINITKSGLSAGTTYSVKLYVKFNNVYQYGTAITASTDAVTPAPDPDDNGGGGES